MRSSAAREPPRPATCRPQNSRARRPTITTAANSIVTATSRRRVRWETPCARGVPRRCPTERHREEGAGHEVDPAGAEVGHGRDRGDRHLDGLAQPHREQDRLTQRHQQGHEEKRSAGTEQSGGETGEQAEPDEQHRPWRQSLCMLPGRPQCLEPAQEQHPADQRFHHLAGNDRQRRGPEERAGQRSAAEPERRPRRGSTRVSSRARSREARSRGSSRGPPPPRTAPGKSVRGPRRGRAARRRSRSRRSAPR